jgi:nucleotide-binding universal stress UspA family protein
MVAADNSPASALAAQWGVALARRCGATVTAVHVYNARQHEFAFRKMEVSLPPQHQDPVALAEQRSAHQTLIQDSLGLIAHCYLDGVKRRCEEEGVPFEGKTIEGKHYLALSEEAANHGLICLGAQGLGWVAGSLIGSVCERVLRRCRADVLIARRNERDEGNAQSQTAGRTAPKAIAVGVDGSEHSLAAVRHAAWLAETFGASLEGIYVFDPFFHSLAFNRMKGVLSGEADCLFRTGDQEALHDAVINKGLRHVGERHLQVASEAARPWVEEMAGTVLEGKPFVRIASHAQSGGTDLLVVGRFGSHFSPAADIGSTAENLARLAPCSVLVVNSQSRS